MYGELCVGGEGLARGYLGRAELTAEKFVPDPAWVKRRGRRLYRTGDLCRWGVDGQLEYLGRRDHQVKVRGYRVELGEIETVLEEHPKVRRAVVTGGRGGTEERRLTAYVEWESGEGENGAKLETSSLRDYLRARLPEYMVPAVYVKLEEIPLNPSGKVDRKALPAPERVRPESLDSFVAPRNPMEEELARIWAEVLKIERVGIHDNFFELGGHSLLATQLISRVRDALSVELPLREIFDKATIAELAEAIRRPGREVQAPPIEPVPRDRELPLSFAQQRLWFLDQLVPGNAFYNLPAAVRLGGPLDLPAFKRVFQEILRRHEVLRTSFTLVDGRTVQVISPPIAPENVHHRPQRAATSATRGGGASVGELRGGAAVRPGPRAACCDRACCAWVSSIMWPC